MSVHTFYRLAVWLPIAMPALVVLLVHGLGLRGIGISLDEVFQILLASLVYGGIPYAPIAIWATFWIDNHPERDIRRRALQTPLWMILTFLMFAAYLAVVSGELIMATVVFVLGVMGIVSLGYLYVVIVFSLRDVLCGPYTDYSTTVQKKWRWS